MRPSRLARAHVCLCLLHPVFEMYCTSRNVLTVGPPLVYSYSYFLSYTDLLLLWCVLGIVHGWIYSKDWCSNAVLAAHTYVLLETQPATHTYMKRRRHKTPAIFISRHSVVLRTDSSTTTVFWCPRNKSLRTRTSTNTAFASLKIRYIRI